eukprot:2396793-Rhodomonas_salina.1
MLGWAPREGGREGGRCGAREGRSEEEEEEEAIICLARVVRASSDLNPVLEARAKGVSEKRRKVHVALGELWFDRGRKSPLEIVHWHRNHSVPCQKPPTTLGIASRCVRTKQRDTPAT